MKIKRISKFSSLSLVGLLSAAIFSFNAQAATVTLVTPAGDSATSSDTTYSRFGDDYELFQFGPGESGFADPLVNGGEEFILLGAHQTLLHPDEGLFSGCTAAMNCDTELDVFIQNLNTTAENPTAGTGPVSLLLTAREEVAWNLTVEDGVDLRQIYVFGVETEGLSLSVNGEQLLSGTTSSNASVEFVSNLCAIAWPEPNPEWGCTADQLISSLDSEGIDLEITQYNTAYHVDSFTVGLSSTPIPLPAAGYLFLSGLAAICTIRRKMR